MSFRQAAGACGDSVAKRMRGLLGIGIRIADPRWVRSDPATTAEKGRRVSKRTR